MALRPRQKTGSFRTLRIALLLLILLAVAGDAWLTRVRSTDWDEPLWVSVSPINGDGSEAAGRYIATLSDQSFEPVEAFLAREAARYGLTLRAPARVRLAPEVREHPPTPPANGRRVAIMVWSLEMRYWAWRVARKYGGPPVNIRMFVQYFDPGRTDRVAHSLGLQKGMVGVVNAFASRKLAGQNNVVIAHELLHTVGASDKYDPASSQPLYPQGFADRGRTPLYPQMHAEIMGGRIPLSAQESALPMDLNKVIVGPETALEINWVRPAS